MGGRGLWHGHTARDRRTREGAISRGSNFGLRGGEEGKADLFFFFFTM